MTDNLTPSMQRAMALGEERLAQSDEDKSAHALRAELRKMRIDYKILELQLAAANRRVAQYEASKALVAEMARDAEGTCP